MLYFAIILDLSWSAACVSLSLALEWLAFLKTFRIFCTISSGGWSGLLGTPGWRAVVKDAVALAGDLSAVPFHSISAMSKASLPLLLSAWRP